MRGRVCKNPTDFERFFFPPELGSVLRELVRVTNSRATLQGTLMIYSRISFLCHCELIIDLACSSVGRASDRHAVDASSIPRCGKGFFSESQLSVQTLLRCCTLPCAIACINICAHIKDPLVHVRIRWIMEALKHPACTVGWVARLCCSWLSPGKAIRISQGINPIGTIQF